MPPESGIVTNPEDEFEYEEPLREGLAQELNRIDPPQNNEDPPKKEDEKKPPAGNEPRTETIKGVEYTVDDEGHYCLNGVKVLDEKKVSFRNRAEELKRKSTESSTEMQERLAQLEQQLQSQQQEQANKPPEHDPDDIDPETGMTWRALDVLQTRQNQALQKQINEIRIESLTIQANSAITAKKAELAGVVDPETGLKEYGDIFDDPEMSVKLDQKLEKLSIQARLNPQIVEQAISLVRGENVKQIIKNTEKRVRDEINTKREIVDEVKSPPAGGSGGTATPGKSYSPEVRALAKSNNLTLEEAQTIIDYEKELDGEGKK